MYSGSRENNAKIYQEHKNLVLGRKSTPARLINTMTHINYVHKFLFDYENLNDLALNNGFKNFVSNNSENIENEGIR